MRTGVTIRPEAIGALKSGLIRNVKSIRSFHQPRLRLFRFLPMVDCILPGNPFVSRQCMKCNAFFAQIIKMRALLSWQISTIGHGLQSALYLAGSRTGFQHDITG